MPSTDYAAQLAHLRARLADNEAWFRAHPDQQAGYQQRRNEFQRQITRVQQQQAAAVGNAPAGTGPNVPAGQNAPPTPGGLPVDNNPQSAPWPTVRPPGEGGYHPGHETIQTPEQIAAAAATAQATAAAEAGARQRAALDAWDRLNSQRDYDPDGWQSMGFQPDYIPMPAGWAENNWLPPKPPAVPAGTTPALLPGSANISTGPPSNTPQIAGAVTATQPANALAALGGTAPALAPAAPAMSAAAQPWTQQPDPGAWGQSPRPQRQAASPWGPGPMGGQRDPSKYGQAWLPGGRPMGPAFGPTQPKNWGTWGQKPAQAGTWGSGTV